jgi:predicted dehydrogenase
MVVYDDVEAQEKIKIYDKGVKAIRRTDTFAEFQFSYHYGDIISPYIRFEEPLRVECLHFEECIRENKRPLTDGYNGLRVVEIIEAAQRSLKNGGNQEAVFGKHTNNTNGHAKVAGATGKLQEYSVVAD